MSRNARVTAVTLISLALVSACEPSAQMTNNSSQDGNDYFAEPLSAHSEQYSAALKTSNNFIEALSQNQLDEAYGLLDPRLQAAFLEKDFRASYESVIQEFGAIVEYKPMQWGFATNPRLENVVISVKIVVHENAEAFYILNFEDDGHYQRIIAFKVHRRSDGERVVQAAAKAYGLD